MFSSAIGSPRLPLSGDKVPYRGALWWRPSELPAHGETAGREGGGRGGGSRFAGRRCIAGFAGVGGWLGYWAMLGNSRGSAAREAPRAIATQPRRSYDRELELAIAAHSHYRSKIDILSCVGFGLIPFDPSGANITKTCTHRVTGIDVLYRTS